MPAPHGGFLVLPAVAAVGGWGSAFLWVLAILIGAVIAGLILGLVQRRRALKDGTVNI
jgi:PTS system fructose-specific IIC component